MLWSIQTDLEYVHSVVAGLEKEWVYFSAFFFFFDGYKQKSINIVKDWKDCKCVCVCPIFDVTNGLHSPGFLQSWAQACWRWSPHQLPITPISTTSKRLLETPKRESGMEVRAVTLNEGKKCDGNYYGNGGEISPGNEWNRAELWWGLQKTIKDESGESRRGESRRELLGRLRRYLVFHRHFSKSDQGHQQQHPLPLSLCSVQLLLSSLLIFAL